MEYDPLEDVVVSYIDPFDVWEEIKANLLGILPLPVNTKKINGTHLKKYEQLLPGVTKGFVENATFHCRYVKAAETPEGTKPTDTSNPDEPYMHLYVLPPMEYEFFKQNARTPLKAFVSALKGKRVVIVYGICNKDNHANQKANSKTIQKIRGMLSSISLSHTRFCLVPMLGLPLLTGFGAPVEDVEPAETEDVGAVKNWENLKTVMSDCVSETVAYILLEAVSSLKKNTTASLHEMFMFHDSVLRVYSKFGSVDIAIDGYIDLITKLKNKHLHSLVSPSDLTGAPFIFFLSSVYKMGAVPSAFDLYQYFCYCAVRLLQRQNTAGSLSRACDLLLDCCMLVFKIARKDTTVRPLLWFLTFVHQTLEYIQSRVKSMSELTDLFDQLNLSIGHANMSPSTAVAQQLKKKLSVKYPKDGTPKDGNGSNLSSPKSESMLIDIKPGASTDFVCQSSIQCVQHLNIIKNIRRYIGLFYTFEYKALTILSKLASDGAMLDIGDGQPELACYREYRQLESQLWNRLQDQDTRRKMLIDTVRDCALNFSQGDLPRFSNVVSTTLDDKIALSSINRDCNLLGWNLSFLRKNTIQLNPVQLYAWIGVYEPNHNIENALEIIQACLYSNLDTIENRDNLCLSPNPSEDEAVNDYLRALSEAKMNISDLQVDTSNFYGQSLGYTSKMCQFQLNVYLHQEWLDASIRICLREETKAIVDSHAVSHTPEEILLNNVKLQHGLNVFELKHSFKHCANYILESIVISGDGYQITQQPGTPIPLAILSGVVRSVKAQKVKSCRILQCLMLPIKFAYSPADDSVKLCAYPCTDASANSEPVLLRDISNYICFQITGFSGGRVVIAGDGINYDLSRISLYSQGEKNLMINCEKSDEGIVLNIAETKKCNHVICAPVTVNVDVTKASIYQVVSIYERSTRSDIRLDFTVLPPFCRGITTTAGGYLETILHTMAPYYTLVESVLVDGAPFVIEPTLLEPSTEYHISLNGTNSPSTSDAIQTIHSAETSGRTPKLPNDAMPSIAEGNHESSFEYPNEDTTDTTASTGLTGSNTGDREVVVNYRLLRHMCSHHSRNDDTGLEPLSDALQYRFTVSEFAVCDILVDYNAPKFCLAGVPFESRITLRATRDLASFEYELDRGDEWTLEGPVRGNEQSLKCSETLQLRFKMTVRPTMPGAIVGAGPCGLYLAKNLRGRVSSGARVDIFERLSQPLGLLRYGVAPDSVSIRDSGKALLAGTTERFFFNVRVGTDISIDELKRYYHVCLLSCGAESPRKFKIHNDDAKGVFDALDLVRWYNGHPEAPSSVPYYIKGLTTIGRPIHVSVIGNGNVSLDIARILLSSTESLEITEVNKEFLECLRQIHVASVRIIGRRGIHQSSFTNAEVRRILESTQFIPYTDLLYLDQSALFQPPVLDRRSQRRFALFRKLSDNIHRLDGANTIGGANDTTAGNNIETTNRINEGSHKHLKFDFFKSVLAIERGNNRSITGVILEDNRLDENFVAHATGNRHRLASDMLIKCVGFERCPTVASLLAEVDSRRVFGCGWFATNGKGDLSNTLAATNELARIVSSCLVAIPDSKMSDLEALDDCDGLMFQHGPEVDFTFDHKDDEKIRIQVSNPHDLLFVAQQTTLCIYKLSDLASSVVANESHHQHKLDTVVFQHGIKRIRVKPESHLLACQFASSVEVYDFSAGSTKTAVMLDADIHSMHWSGDKLVIRDVNSVIHSITLDGTITELISDCVCISPLGDNGKHAICRFGDGLSIQVFSDTPDRDRFHSVELPENYDITQVTDVAGCHVLSDDLCAIGLVMDNQDSLILLCKYDDNHVEVMHCGFNELFLTPTGEPIMIEFLWIKQWECLFALSNVATMVVVLSRHPNLGTNSQWHVLNMKEGYGLESVDIDCCPTDLAVCTSYRDTVYRKNADVDAPLLTDPPLFLMAQGSTKVTLNYADICLIDQNQNEIQQLPPLRDGNEGIYFKVFTPSKASSATGGSIEKNHIATKPFGFSGLLETLSADRSTTSGDSVTNLVTSIEDSQDGGASDVTADDNRVLIVPRVSSIDDIISSNILTCSTHGLGDPVAAKIHHIYEAAIRQYDKLEAEAEVKLQRMRLMELMCNTFHIFEHHLQDCEAMAPEKDLDFSPMELAHWTQEIEQIKNMQKEIIDCINSRPKLGSDNLVTVESDPVSDLGDITGLYQRCMQLYTSRFDVQGPQVELAEMENAFNAMQESLKVMNQRLDDYEKRLTNLENQRVLSQESLPTTARDHSYARSSDDFIYELDNLINRLRETRVGHIANSVLQFQEVGPIYANYDKFVKRGTEKQNGKGDIPVSLIDKTSPKIQVFQKELDADDSQIVSFPSFGSSPILSFKEPTKHDALESGSKVDNDTQATDSKPTEMAPNVEPSLSAPPSFAGSVSDSTQSSFFGQSTTLAQANTQENKDIIPTIKAPEGEVLQRQSYTFGDIGNTSSLTLGTGLQVPLPSSNETTRFASFASKSTMSFADLAMSSGSGNNMFGSNVTGTFGSSATVTSPFGSSATVTSPFGSSSSGNNMFGSSAFPSSAPSGGFTGLSGFTSGSFQKSITPGIVPSLGGFGGIKPASGTDNTAPTTAATDSIWNSVRRSDPLD
ncbi:NADP oxidoreductase [Babesia ovis]|uniref:NADP oxidoreductase n=1 Tax=Babesia ovis TaxID=5869 RepID=A0A9W5WT99_BABOV|nr:NADP oxidoreductase [Babesia ovis]